MDTNHFLSLMGLMAHMRKNLESIMDGQISREGLGGVELPLAGLRIVEKSTPGIFLQREYTIVASMPPCQMSRLCCRVCKTA